jgi:hypothetical protein
MKAYETLDAVAAADPAELAEKCGTGKAAAKAARAAAKLALENREAGKKRLSAEAGRGGAGKGRLLAGLAAEEEPEYGG